MNAVATNGAGIGHRLIGLQPPLSPPPAASAVPPASRPAPFPPPAAVVVATAPSPPAPAPVAQTAPSPSTDNPLVRLGLLSTDQVDEALEDQRSSGKHVAQIAVERGWVTREQLAELVSQPAGPAAPAAPEPEPAPVAAPVFEVAPEPEPESRHKPKPKPKPKPESKPEPKQEPVQTAPALESVARVYARLATGERIEVASFPELQDARMRAEEVVRDLSAERPEWPCFSGRFVRPEAIVSLDVEATLE